MRIDAAKRDHHVAVFLGRICNLLVGDATATRLRLTVHRKHHQTQLAFTVIRNGLFNGGAVATAEILVRRAVVFFAVVVKWIAATHLGMGVDVNGNKVFVVHGESVAFLMGVS